MAAHCMMLGDDLIFPSGIVRAYICAARTLNS
jgi:hypothetical protein